MCVVRACVRVRVCASYRIDRSRADHKQTSQHPHLRVPHWRVLVVQSPNWQTYRGMQSTYRPVPVKLVLLLLQMLSAFASTMKGLPAQVFGKFQLDFVRTTWIPLLLLPLRLCSEEEHAICQC